MQKRHNLMTELQLGVSVLIELLHTKIQISREILCREPIKINDNRHNYDFIGVPLNM